MRARETMKFLAGSAAIYALVAACSAGPGEDWAGNATGIDDDVSADSGIADALADAWDAIANPVPDAQAAEDSGSVEPPKPDVATVACEEFGALQFAVKEYPGKSVEELASVRAFGKLHPSYAGAAFSKVPGGATHAIVAGLTLRDGAVVAGCGDATLKQYTEVIFVLPN